MSKLFAFLVAIDEYPIERHKLSGCVNDLNDIESYLSNHFDKEIVEYRSHILLNEAASRENIIKGFDHFAEATEEDICLFFFCGHGSQAPAPEEFWHIEPDRMNESLVCWDSRLPDGMDLMDKELSYLIWKATKDKHPHFVVIMDCCHAGSNTRAVDVKARMAEPSHLPSKIEHYHGFEFYKKSIENNKTNVSPPRGNHIHLAAARSIETAKELKVEGSSRGIFTYNLIKTLQQSGGHLSYADLVKRIRIKTANRVANQSPQVEATQANDILKPFLKGAIAFEKSQFLISFDNNLGWVVDAGAADGIVNSSESSDTIFKLKDSGDLVKIQKVFPNQSSVSGMETFEKGKIYEAIIIQRSTPKLKVAFAENSEPEGVQFLKGILKENSQFIELVANTEGPQYFIKIVDQSFQLTLPDDERPVFKRAQGLSQPSATEFLNKTETVAKWVQTIELANPTSSIRDQEIKIELFKIDQPGNIEDSAPASEMDWHSPAVFSYEKRNGEWHSPAFRLKITNTGNRLLWVHALYIGNDFSITDQLLPKQDLKPGEEVWLTDVSEGFPYKTIPLQLEDAYQAWGISEIKELVKLFISTEELAVHRFNQDGLQQDTATSSTRGIGRRQQVSGPDWTTREIELIIKRPIDEIDEIAEAEPEEEVEVEITEPDEVPPPPLSPVPNPSPQPPRSSSPPKGSSDSITNKLKKWLSDFTSPNKKKAESSPIPTRSEKMEDLFSEDDFEKIYPELEEETAGSEPPAETERSIKTQPDELLEETVPETGLPDALKTKDGGDQVDCSVYAPPTAQKGDDVFIQVWLHLPDLSQEVKVMAMEFDEDASQRAFQSLKVPLEKGEEISLVLETKGIELDETVQHITWNGNIQSAQFIASIPDDFAKKMAVFTLRVFKGELPIGHIKFILKITAEAVVAIPQPVGIESKRYKKAFISYSSKDRNEVLKRVQMLEKLDIPFFQDVLTLNPGERWEQELYKNIDDSDIFFLFWSNAAKESKWVLQELEYAINLKHGNEENPPLIQPVPIEGPPIVSPPEKLGHMHFNDRILYFIVKE